MEVTKANFESILDAGNLFAAMRNGKWWRIRRNGKTQRWVRDPNRVRVPIKAGLKATSSITETDFIDGKLKADLFRHADDVPAKV